MEVALAIISGFIAGNLLAGNGPIWPAITLYWILVTVKLFGDIWKK